MQDLSTVLALDDAAGVLVVIPALHRSVESTLCSDWPSLALTLLHPLVYQPDRWRCPKLLPRFFHRQVDCDDHAASRVFSKSQRSCYASRCQNPCCSSLDDMYSAAIDVCKR